MAQPSISNADVAAMDDLFGAPSPPAPRRSLGPHNPPAGQQPRAKPLPRPTADEPPVVEVSEDSADPTLLAPAAAEPPAPPPAPPSRLTQYAPGRQESAWAAKEAAFNESMAASASSGLCEWERERNANIAGGQALMKALGIDGGLVGVRRGRARARPNYSEARPRAVLSEEERAARDFAKAERQRLREEARAAREAKDAEKAERLEQKAAEAEARAKNLKIACADPTDPRVQPGLLGPPERKVFAETYCDRYGGSKYHGREQYVIQVDVRAKIKCPMRPVTG